MSEQPLPDVSDVAAEEQKADVAVPDGDKSAKEAPVVREKKVRPAVVVVVENSQSARHGFGRVAFGRLGTVQFEVDGMVSEMNRRWGILTGEDGPEDPRQYRDQEGTPHLRCYCIAIFR